MDRYTFHQKAYSAEGLRIPHFQPVSLEIASRSPTPRKTKPVNSVVTARTRRDLRQQTS